MSDPFDNIPTRASDTWLIAGIVAVIGLILLFVIQINMDSRGGAMFDGTVDFTETPIDSTTVRVQVYPSCSDRMRPCASPY